MAEARTWPTATWAGETWAAAVVHNLRGAEVNGVLQRYVSQPRRAGVSLGQACSGASPSGVGACCPESAC